MLKKYKNQIFEFLTEFGPAPEAFKLIDDGEHFYFSLTGTSMWFAFVQDSNSYHSFHYGYAEFSPENKEYRSYADPDAELSSYSFEDVFEVFVKWSEGIDEYIEETKAPDLWAELQKQKTITDFTGQADDQYTPFTDEQKDKIRLGLNEAKLTCPERI